MLMRKKILAALSAVAISTIAATGVAASETSLPTIGVRSQGMGNAFVAVANDVNAIAWNPAGLAFVEDQQIEINHQDLFDLGADANYAAYAQKKFGFGWLHIDSGSGFLLGGGDFTQDLYIFSGSQQLDPQTYVGASFKWHRQKFSAPGVVLNNTPADDYDADGYSFDVGAIYRVDEATNVAITIYDIIGEIKSGGPSGDSDNLDPNVTIGFARKPNPNTTFALQISRLGEESYVHVGLEKKLENQLTVRAGLDDEVFTAGLGFTHEKWDFDYSFKNKVSLGLDKTQRFGARVHF